MAVPADTPETIPVVEPALATARLLLVHVPPGTPSVNTLVDPVHIDVIPVIAPGVATTFTALVA